MKPSQNTYNFEDALKRIDNVVSASEIQNGIVVVQTIVMYVQIKDNGHMKEVDNVAIVEKQYSCLLNEIFSLLDSSDLCQNFEFVGNAFIAYFKNSDSSFVNRIFDTAAQIRSIVDVINFKFNNKDNKVLRVGIAMDMGEILLVNHIMNSDDIEIRLGNIVNKLRTMATYAGSSLYDEVIMVTKAIYDLLNPNYQSLFSFNNTRNCYNSSAINIAMNKWLTDNKKTSL